MPLSALRGARCFAWCCLFFEVFFVAVGVTFFDVCGGGGDESRVFVRGGVVTVVWVCERKKKKVRVVAASQPRKVECPECEKNVHEQSSKMGAPRHANKTKSRFST